MLYGLLENALGWHFAEDIRKDVFKKLQKEAAKVNKKHPDWKNSEWLTQLPTTSGSGFFSLLQYHMAFEDSIFEPATMTYDDLWSQSLRDEGRSFFGGSKHYDASLERVITKARRKQIEFGDREEHKRMDESQLEHLPENAKVKYGSIRHRFPQYYSSPKIREYVEVKSNYMFRFSATPTVAGLIREAIEDPAAPLYLGTNDGWVHVQIEDLA